MTILTALAAPGPHPRVPGAAWPLGEWRPAHPLAGARWVTDRRGRRALVMPVPEQPGQPPGAPLVHWRVEWTEVKTCPHESADHPAMSCPQAVPLYLPHWRDPGWQLGHGRQAEARAVTPPDEVLERHREMMPDELAAAPRNAHSLWTKLWAAGHPALLTMATVGTHRRICAACGASGRKHEPGCVNDPKREAAGDTEGGSDRKTRDVPAVLRSVGVTAPGFAMAGWERVDEGKWSPVSAFLVVDGRLTRMTYTELVGRLSI